MINDYQFNEDNQTLSHKQSLAHVASRLKLVLNPTPCEDSSNFFKIELESSLSFPLQIDSTFLSSFNNNLSVSKVTAYIDENYQITGSLFGDLESIFVGYDIYSDSIFIGAESINIASINAEIFHKKDSKNHITAINAVTTETVLSAFGIEEITNNIFKDSNSTFTFNYRDKHNDSIKVEERDTISEIRESYHSDISSVAESLNQNIPVNITDKYGELIGNSTGTINSDLSSADITLDLDLSSDYILPAATVSELGGIKLANSQADLGNVTYRFPVQLTAENRAYVEIPETEVKPVLLYMGPITWEQLLAIQHPEDGQFYTVTDKSNQEYFWAEDHWEFMGDVFAVDGSLTIKTKVGENDPVTVSEFTVNEQPEEITFVQGDNVTLTTDATNKTITIAAQDTVYTAGNAIDLTNNEIGVVTDNTTIKTDVFGALYVDGQLTDTTYSEGTNISITGNNNAITAKGYVYKDVKHSFAENNTSAEGGYSHSEGRLTNAFGDASHSEGTGNVQLNQIEVTKTTVEELALLNTKFGKIYSYRNDDNMLSIGKYSFVYDTQGNLISKILPDSVLVEDDPDLTDGVYFNVSGSDLFDGISDTVECSEFLGCAIGNNAHSEGYLTLAQGSISHSEGNKTEAIGNKSHSEGDSSITYGTTAHAEGYKTLAVGNVSHAEGNTTKSVGDYSHAEGSSTTVNLTFKTTNANSTVYIVTNVANNYKMKIGDIVGYRNIFAEILDIQDSLETDPIRHTNYKEITLSLSINPTFKITSYSSPYICKGIAYGEKSHSEGENSKAVGYTSHTEGYETVAFNDCEHSEGSLNVSHKNSANYGDAGNTLHSIGIGDYDPLSNNEIRKNAFEVMQNGDIYIINNHNAGEYDGTNAGLNGVRTLQELLQDTNSASLQIANANDKKINTTETTNKYIQFTGGTDKFTVSDGSNSFDVSVSHTDPTVNDGAFDINTDVSGTITKVADFTANQAASDPNDSITFVLGTNVTLTPDATNKKITIAATDTTYSTATTNDLGLVKSTTTGTTANRDYNVEVNSNGTMKVNVPWTDTVTTNTDETQKISSSAAKTYLTGITTVPTSTEVAYKGVANDGVYATNGSLHLDGNISHNCTSYTKTSTGSINVTYMSTKYVNIDCNYEGNLDIYLNQEGTFDGVKEVVCRINNTDLFHGYILSVRVNYDNPSSDSVTNLKNFYTSNLTSSTGSGLNADKSMELVFTFWGVNDVTFNGGMSV